MKRLIFFGFLLLIPIMAFSAPAVRITTDAYDNRIEVGETFHITIEAQDCAGKLNITQKPEGVKEVYHTTHSTSSTSIQNGKTLQTNTTSLILTCKGEKIGKYRFGPVSVDGVKSNVLAYEVVASTGKNKSQTPKSNASSPFDPNGGPLFIGKGNEEMFLKASVNKTTAYEQEAIEYTVKLYTTYGDIKFLGAAAAPKFDGFVVEESDDVSKSLTFEDYHGKTYKTAIIARYIIFPQKSGKLKVEGNTYTVSTDARQYYHDPYFQTMTVKYPVQLNVTPNDIVIDAKELPAPVPDNFIGGVGKFRLESSMPTTSLSTNTAASLILTVEGTGNIKYLKLPDLSTYYPAAIEVFTPESTSDVKVGTSNVSGSAKFDYSIVAHESGNFTLAPIKLTYFDPEDGQYKQLETKQFELTVSLGQSSSKSQQTMTFNEELMPEGTISQKMGYPYVRSLLYWLWYIIPVILFAMTLALYRKYLRDHEDIAQLRSKQANKMALKRLSKAFQCYKNKQEGQFYDEMLAALWGYLGDKLKMPTSELNRSNVSEEFKKHGVKEDTFMPIIKLIDECEYAKYTPVSREANMRQLYYDALTSLAQVESEYDKEKGIKEDEDNDDETADGNE